MSDRSSLADLEITVSTDEASATSAVSASLPLPTRSFTLVEVPADGPQASTGSLLGRQLSLPKLPWALRPPRTFLQRLLLRNFVLFGWAPLVVWLGA